MIEIIKFDDPVVLIGGGDVDVDLLKRYAHLPIVAADGGANLLRKVSLVPAAVIGDLDSVDDVSHWQKTSNVIELTEQDTTDFEKCLYSIDAPYFIAIGFTGNRFDHTLTALHVMYKWHGEKPVILLSGDDVICVRSSAVELDLPIGTRVSVYPLNRITFASSSGLLYPLTDLTMQAGEVIGTSNACSDGSIRIEPGPGNGCYALILPATEFKAMTLLF